MPIPLGILAVAGAGAAGGASSFDLLQTTVLTGNASVSFTGLNSYSDYKHLQLRYVARGNSGNLFFVRTRLNGITTGSYSHHLLAKEATDPLTSKGAANISEITYGGMVAGDSNDANVFGAGVMDILDFSSASKNTTIRAFSGCAGSAEFKSVVMFSSGALNSTAAITQIDLYGTYLTGSRFSLYGIK